MWPLEEIIRRNEERAERALQGKPEVEREEATARNTEQAEWDAGQPPRVVKTYFGVHVTNPSSPVLPITARRLYSRFGEQVRKVGLASVEVGIRQNGQDTTVDTRHVFFGELDLLQNVGNSEKLADFLDDLCIDFGVQSVRLQLDGDDKIWVRRV